MEWGEGKRGGVFGAVEKMEVVELKWFSGGVFVSLSDGSSLRSVEKWWVTGL